jgi:hypothetical protein
MKPKDWKQSLVTMGAIAILGCRSVPNMKLLGPAPIDTWPSKKAYEANLAKYFQCMKASLEASIQAPSM